MNLFSKRKNIECPECVEKFVGRNEMIEHFENNHGKIAGNCPRCSRAYIHHDSLITHIKNNEKVNLGYQIGILVLGLIIPFVWLYPFHKINKLGYGLIISIILTAGMFMPMFFASELNSVPDVGLILFFILYFGKIPVLFYFLIRWSRKWNAWLDSKINEI
mgnify:CR=1 FL=1